MLKSRKYAGFVMALAFLAALFQASPANAIGFLISANPTFDQQLTTAPHAISLEFSVPSIPASLSGNVIRVTNSSGTPVELGAATTHGNILSVNLRSNLEPGKFQVAYRYVCDDGHVLVSAYSFSIVAPGAPEPPTDEQSKSNPKPRPKKSATVSPSPTRSSSALSSEGPSSSPDTSVVEQRSTPEPSSPQEAPVSAGAATDLESNPGSIGAGVVGVSAVLVLLGAGIVIRIRRRRSRVK